MSPGEVCDNRGMLFGELAKYLEKLEAISSRLQITSILKELFDKTPAKEIDKVVYLSLGILAPNYEGVILNLAEKMMLRALSLAYEKDLEKVKALYKKSGDIGDTAQSLSRESTKTLTVTQVYEELLAVARDNGEGSQERKLAKMADLLNKLDPLSARFVSRIPVGRLRLGFSEKTVLDALGAQEKYFNIRPDIGYIAKLVKSNKLQEISPKVGVPVVPMLPARLNSPTDMIKKMGEVSVEPKFDGLRIFIHYQKPNFIKIFTRNMNYLDENIFPELKKISKYLKADNLILDTEAVGLDPRRQFFVDFQTTMNRRRKHNIDKSSSDTPLQFQVFDMLFVDGKSLLEEPYLERRKMLKNKITNGDLLRIDENTVTKDPEVIRKLHQKYLEMGLEGVIVKRADGRYVSGRTGWNWVKMKEEEGQQGRLSDTLDCIVMGYFTGKGKRTQFGLGKILVGIKDGDSVRTLTKVGTGLTEDMLVEIKKQLDKLRIKEKPKEYEAQRDLIPDVWAIPSLVVEVTADSISKSTKYSLGFSLRFPRFLKIRKDKGPGNATQLEELKKLWKLSH